MLRRHLLQTSAMLGVGTNRRAIASSILKRYGYIDSSLMLLKLSSPNRCELGHEDEKVGVVILDDGMQVFVFAAPQSLYFVLSLL